MDKGEGGGWVSEGYGMGGGGGGWGVDGTNCKTRSVVKAVQRSTDAAAAGLCSCLVPQEIPTLRESRLDCPASLARLDTRLSSHLSRVY